MISIKTIIFCDETDKYSKFIDICKSNFRNIVNINNTINFIKEIMISKDDILIVFIDKKILDNLSENSLNLLKNEKLTCIVLLDNMNEENEIDYFEYLSYNETDKVNRFMKKLNQNIYLKLKLYNNYKKLNKFYDIGKQLFAEKNIENQINLVVDYSMEITNCDAATIYIIIDKDTEKYSFYEKNINDKLLKFMVSKNNSIDINLKSSKLEISISSIIGASVISGKPIRIDDAYNIPDTESYKFNRSFDEATGYSTKSVLTIPMKDHEERVIGVIQLINKKDNDIIIPFNSEDESLMYSLAGQAAVVLEKNLLYNILNALLEKERDTIKNEISKRMSADEEITKLLSAVEHSPVSIIITDTEGRIQYVNPKFEGLTGYTFAEVTQKNPRIFKSGKHDNAFYNNLWITLLNGDSWIGEIFNKKKNGEYYWANSSIAPVKNSSGNLAYFIAVQEDITERKRLLSELDEKNYNLEKTIKQLQLSQAQLIHSEKLAGIGQLAAGVAHEMNTPLGFTISNLDTLGQYLGTIKELLAKYQNLANHFSDNEYGYLVNMLQTYEKDNKISYILDDTTNILEECNEGLTRVSNIVNALRSFSSIDHLEGTLMFDINTSINNTLLMLQNELHNQVIVHKELGNIPMINVDGKEFNQALLHLIKNAAYAVKDKYSTLNKGIIIIRTYLKENNVFIEIEDNGIGIEEKNVNRVFEPFFTTKPVGKAIGLGLSIVYDIIVSKHKGEISFTTDYGIGTKFTIKLHI